MLEYLLKSALAIDEISSVITGLLYVNMCPIDCSQALWKVPMMEEIRCLLKYFRFSFW